MQRGREAHNLNLRSTPPPNPNPPFNRKKKCGAVKSGEGSGQGMPPLGENTAPVQYSVKKGQALSCRVGCCTNLINHTLPILLFLQLGSCMRLQHGATAL